MGLFKKKQQPATAEVICPAKGCNLTCSDPKMMGRHIDWKHPELTQATTKVK